MNAASPIDPFAPWKLRGLELRNRFIKAATFEGHCLGGRPDPKGLARFHEAFAKGGGWALHRLLRCRGAGRGALWTTKCACRTTSLTTCAKSQTPFIGRAPERRCKLAHGGGFSKWKGWVGKRARRGPSNGLNDLGMLVGTPFTRALRVAELPKLADNYRSAATRGPWRPALTPWNCTWATAIC